MKNEDGFTMIEVVVLLAVMSFLALFGFIIVSIIHYIVKFW